MKQADEIINLLYTKYFKGIISYEGITRVENYPYPKEAIREAVLNAIAHKNYATLVPIQVKVFADHLVIANDCVFPEDWTIEDLLGQHKSRPYNPLIAGTFYRAGLIESWGRGIHKIIDACQKAGNKPPEFQVKASEMSVSFEAKLLGSATGPKKEIASGEVVSSFHQNEESLKEVLKEADYQKMLPIIKYLSENSSITTKKAEELIGKSNTTAYRYLKALEACKVIRAEGNTDQSRYIRIRYSK